MPRKSNNPEELNKKQQADLAEMTAHGLSSDDIRRLAAMNSDKNRHSMRNISRGKSVSPSAIQRRMAQGKNSDGTTIPSIPVTGPSPIAKGQPQRVSRRAEFLLKHNPPKPKKPEGPPRSRREAAIRRMNARAK